VKLQCWTPRGTESFRSITRRTTAARRVGLLVYDVTSRAKCVSSCPISPSPWSLVSCLLPLPSVSCIISVSRLLPPTFMLMRYHWQASQTRARGSRTCASTQTRTSPASSSATRSICLVPPVGSPADSARPRTSTDLKRNSLTKGGKPRTRGKEVPTEEAAAWAESEGLQSRRARESGRGGAAFETATRDILARYRGGCGRMKGTLLLPLAPFDSPSDWVDYHVLVC